MKIFDYIPRESHGPGIPGGSAGITGPVQFFDSV